jgi:hypothetical protein
MINGRNVIIRGHGEELPLVVVHGRRGIHFSLSTRLPGQLLLSVLSTL